MSTAGDLVAGEIAEHMARSGVTLLGLSQTSGVPVSTLSRRMTDPGSTKLSEVELIARALGTSPWALCGVYDD